MKILFIMQLAPPVHGATTTGENIKSSSLINTAFECTYVRISTLPIKGNSAAIKIFNLLKLYLNVFALLTRNRYDLVYVTPCSSGFAFYKDFVVCMLAKMFCNRVLYHFHDKGISTNKVVPSFIKKLLFSNAKVILSSTCLYYDIKKFVNEANVYYCAYGISDDGLTHDFKRKQHDQVSILFFAHMLRVKGVFDLLEACKILNARGVDFICNFVGSWYDVTEVEFRGFVQGNNLEKKVFFLGPQYGPDKNKVLSRTDIFSLPTFYPMECFPLGILEAMRWSLPVVTTNEGAIPEIIDDGELGFIVNKHNPVALADKLEYLISHEAVREAMGKSARKKFEQNYTIEKFENRLMKIFTDVLL